MCIGKGGPDLKSFIRQFPGSSEGIFIPRDNSWQDEVFVLGSLLDYMICILIWYSINFHVIY